NKNEDEITVTEPKITKQTEDSQSSIDSVFMMINSDDQEEDEYYARYWPLYRMIEKNDWRGVEDFVTNDPDALTAKTVAPGSQTIFHAIVESLVDVESDDATCLLHKLASKVDPQTLARQDVHGHTALYQCAGKGNLRALKVLVKYNPDLTTIRSKGNNLPVHKAAYEGHKDTFRYLLEVTHGVDIFSGNDGAEMLSRLIGANLYDVALDLLKLHPTIGRDSIDSRRIVLNKLAQKPYAFASGSRLGRLQRLIYNCWCQQSFTNTHTSIYCCVPEFGVPGRSRANNKCASVRERALGVWRRRTPPSGRVTSPEV
ncbi:hypothetical protein CUMW_239270, partial [Citrus unshiu]